MALPCPRSEAVYGPQPDPRLRLITGGGTCTGGGYEDNVIVYARLAPGASTGSADSTACAATTRTLASGPSRSAQ